MVVEKYLTCNNIIIYIAINYGTIKLKIIGELSPKN